LWDTCGKKRQLELEIEQRSEQVVQFGLLFPSTAFVVGSEPITMRTRRVDGDVRDPMLNEFKARQDVLVVRMMHHIHHVKGIFRCRTYGTIDSKSFISTHTSDFGANVGIGLEVLGTVDLRLQDLEVRASSKFFICCAQKRT
jgi:hypothetical protein